MEQMTRERLAAYRSNKAEILELDYMLQNRWKSDTMIGNDVVFDYSKGYPMPQSVVGFDQNKYERLQDRDLKRKERLEKECEEVEQFVEAIQDSMTRRIFRIYYIDGRVSVNQEEVSKKVHLERSTISKKIDNYLKDSHKSHDSHL
mgnify:FL=1